MVVPFGALLVAAVFFGFLCSFWLLGLGSSLTVCVLRNAYLGSLVGRGSLYLNQLSTERKSRVSRRCPDAGVG